MAQQTHTHLKSQIKSLSDEINNLEKNIKQIKTQTTDGATLLAGEVTSRVALIHARFLYLKENGMREFERLEIEEGRLKEDLETWRRGGGLRERDRGENIARKTKIRKDSKAIEFSPSEGERKCHSADYGEYEVKGCRTVTYGESEAEGEKHGYSYPNEGDRMCSGLRHGESEDENASRNILSENETNECVNLKCSEGEMRKWHLQCSEDDGEGDYGKSVCPRPRSESELRKWYLQCSEDDEGEGGGESDENDGENDEKDRENERSGKNDENYELLDLQTREDERNNKSKESEVMQPVTSENDRRCDIVCHGYRDDENEGERRCSSSQDTVEQTRLTEREQETRPDKKQENISKRSILTVTQNRRGKLEGKMQGEITAKGNEQENTRYQRNACEKTGRFREKRTLNTNDKQTELAPRFFHSWDKKDHSFFKQTFHRTQGNTQNAEFEKLFNFKTQREVYEHTKNYREFLNERRKWREKMKRWKEEKERTRREEIEEAARESRQREREERLEKERREKKLMKEREWRFGEMKKWKERQGGSDKTEGINAKKTEEEEERETRIKEKKNEYTKKEREIIKEQIRKYKENKKQNTLKQTKEGDARQRDQRKETQKKIKQFQQKDARQMEQSRRRKENKEKEEEEKQRKLDQVKSLVQVAVCRSKTRLHQSTLSHTAYRASREAAAGTPTDSFTLDIGCVGSLGVPWWRKGIGKE